jgi:hypothetical protein
MKFMRLKNSGGHGLAEEYAEADPRALVSGLLDIVQALPVAGPNKTVIRIMHEVDRWEAVGPDADKEYASLNE